MSEIVVINNQTSTASWSRPARRRHHGRFEDSGWAVMPKEHRDIGRPCDGSAYHEAGALLLDRTYEAFNGFRPNQSDNPLHRGKWSEVVLTLQWRTAKGGDHDRAQDRKPRGVAGGSR